LVKRADELTMWDLR